MMANQHTYFRAEEKMRSYYMLRFLQQNSSFWSSPRSMAYPVPGSWSHKQCLNRFHFTQETLNPIK